MDLMNLSIYIAEYLEHERVDARIIKEAIQAYESTENKVVNILPYFSGE